LARRCADLAEEGACHVTLIDKARVDGSVGKLNRGEKKPEAAVSSSFFPQHGSLLRNPHTTVIRGAHKHLSEVRV